MQGQIDGNVITVKFGLLPTKKPSPLTKQEPEASKRNPRERITAQTEAKNDGAPQHRECKLNLGIFC